MDLHTDHGGGMWTTPQCPFTIEYSQRVLDDIRLAVVDAFFSLPRGGAEIGGILLGAHGKGKVIIEDYEALECEHAFGPGFTLSDRDKARLEEMVGAHRTPALLPVGWYHSHTRSEIFLSEADLEIHRQYFPQAWQVALVLRPHTFQPTRAGFFFRGPDGAIHATGSYREFQLQPLPMRPVPAGVPPAERPPEPRLHSMAKVITLAAQPAARAAEPVVEAAAPLPEPAEPEPVEAEPEQAPAAVEPEDETEAAPPHPTPIPQFLQPKPPRSWRWAKPVAVIAAGFAIGAAGYIFRQSWLPLLARPIGLRWTPANAAAPAGPAAAAPAALGLNVLDSDGQLQIRWDRGSRAVGNGSHGVLEISDSGSTSRVLLLDEAHLESGAFTYAREGERVDVALTVEQAGGKAIRESTTFLGKAPAKPEDTAALRKQRDDLAHQNLQIQADLKTVAERNRKLEKALADAQAQLHGQQRQRQLNQIPK